MADMTALQRSLGVSFDDPYLLEQALIHSSCVNENSGLALSSNERLEFLGDAVLGLVIAQRLYHDFPQFSEGEMSQLRAAVVCRDALARVARAIGLGDYLYLGRGEEASGGRSKPANLSRAVEAVIAAVFLDRGLAAAAEVISLLFAGELHTAVSRGAGVDYKSRLQEVAQARQQQLPFYRLVESAGPDHDRRFTVEVVVGDAVLGRGMGKSKREAEADAARIALQRMQTDFTS